MPITVLVIEDEPSITDFLCENLRADDIAVQIATTLAEGVEKLARHQPDVALVDISLPDGSGLDLCRRVREGTFGRSTMGLIVLTARGADRDRVRGFERGADDYVVKPFHYPELLARIKALSARLDGKRDAEVISHDGLEVDAGRRVASLHGRSLELPAKEFDLLLTMARDPLRVFSKQDLLRAVWNYGPGSSTRTLDSHASRLRRRLETLDDGSRYVINRWGVGYSLRAGG